MENEVSYNAMSYSDALENLLMSQLSRVGLPFNTSFDDKDLNAVRVVLAKLQSELEQFGSDMDAVQLGVMPLPTFARKYGTV